VGVWDEATAGGGELEQQQDLHTGGMMQLG